ncbi:recombination-associated protein RdgC [Vespertiliibacter pulmonis]|uniref:Recombination-associated protein RdgC n=1 Tax=Vespertiliibacter pulmonis TaxID=1443036 RepID=A0A3N4VSS0_9PAST|nr:recombination-associated protein RdgC [Vespertiliibacter pulmonis]QLB20044.1 recombination-associated protein RdgC [Vespertiliibacter pulmonis]QLB20110.1 recombination-associated protein RdgC [Vespertiliibacter pulmonis]RPE86078.1 recombination associated protein RdgC [Vespertiliibacter pulmonis]
MFWFKNIIIYRLTSAIDFSNIENALQQSKFSDCQPLDWSKFGWDSPLITSDQLHFESNNQLLLVAHKEEKIIPAEVIQKETNTRIEALEKKEERKLRKTEKQAIKNDVVTTLLPRAFSKHLFTAIWIDIKRQLIFIDTSSSKRAEDTLALLRKTLGSLPVVPLSFIKLPLEVITEWITHNDLPQWLTLLEEAELKSFNDESVIRCKRQDLESDEITNHLEAGKYITKLALDWENHLSFVLKEDGSLSRIKFADDILEKNDDILKEDIAQRFDADFFLMTHELADLIDKLTIEFHGIKETI